MGQEQQAFLNAKQQSLGPQFGWGLSARRPLWHGRIIGFVLPLLLLIGSLLACGVSAIKKPVAPTAPPAFSHSWYLTASVTDPNFTDLKELGKKDALSADRVKCSKTAPHLSMVVFASGHPIFRDGTFGVNSHRYVKINGVNHFDFWSTERVRSGMQQYMNGWFETAQSCDTLVLALGLNNTTCLHNPDVCSTMDFQGAGKAWAEMVNTLNTWIIAKTSRIVVWGADDAETTWDGPAPTRQFIEGFTSTVDNDIPLANFGDITPDQRWSDADVKAVTAGKNIVLLPEVYHDYDLQLWTNLKKKYPEVQFIGVMTECAEDDTRIENDIKNNAGCDAGGSLQYNPTHAWQAIKKMAPNDPLYATTNIQYE